MKKIFRTIIFVLAVAVFIFSGYNILSYLKDAKDSKDVNQNIIDKAVEIHNTQDEENTTLWVDFDKLWQENKDIVAWIYSPNTQINYPVVQTKDNNYYLRRLLNGKYNIAGTIFMDYRNSPDLSDYNTMIYGHNMKNDTMFGSLAKYKKQEYYEEHPVIYIVTPEKKFEMNLFAGYITDANSYIYNASMNKEEQKKYIEDSISLSTFKSNVEISDEEKIVTFSTCSNSSEEDRYILMGVLREIK